MRGRMEPENDLYLDLQQQQQQQHEQRPSSAPPDPHQFQFPIQNNNSEENVNLLRNNAWKSNNQPVASPLFDPSSSSRQVWSNNKNNKTRPSIDQYYSKYGHVYM